ncbi:MAG: radical SAM protein, partial [Planctomycetes bacterium]|nr:radical SAM protein [Planctomycetota bacterium]
MDDIQSVVEAVLYDKLVNGHARCNVCQRRCVIAPGKKGFCKGRLNQDGKLVSLLYGWVSSKHLAPIEIKPLYHFWPGSHALSLGSFGCNFRCKGCQNWHISRAELDTREAEFISPEAAVALARRLGCQGLSWTYNEPTIWFEYTLESAKLAKQAGLYTNYVTNGFITPEALALIGPYLDSFRVDIKGFSDT